MLSALVEFAIRFRVLVIGAAAALVFFGSDRLRQMPVDILPEFSPPVVEIQTEAVGLSAAEVETMVSLSIEELMAGLPWLKSLTSESVAGLSSIRLEFEPKTPLIRARQLVQERLTTAFLLPNVAKSPIMQQPTSSTNRVLMMSLASKDMDPIALSVITQWTVKPKLLGIPGVAKVSIWGERRRQLQVQVDPETLRRNGITMRQIISSTGDSLWVSHLSFLKSSVASTGGYLDTNNQRMEIRHILPVSSPADLAKISIDGAKQLTLGDVADVVEGHPPLIGDAIVQGGQGLLLVVEKFPGANTVEVTRAVEEALAELRPGLTGIKIDSQAFRPATFVEWSIANLGRVALAAWLLAVAGLAALLLNWRAVAIGLVALPLSLLSACLVLDFMGATINALVIAGFAAALASIVDDLVCATESLDRRLHDGNRATGGAAPLAGPLADLGVGAIIRDSILDVRRPVLFAMLISLLAISPLVFVEGRSGIFMQPLARAYALALLASTIVTLLVVPALAALLSGWLPAPPVTKEPRALARVLAKPFQVSGQVSGQVAGAAFPPFGMVAALLALVVVALAAVPTVWHDHDLRSGLLPRFEEREIVVYWEAAPGISHDEMLRITTKLTGELQAVPGVRAVNAHLGRAISGDQAVSINSSRIWIRIDPEAVFAQVLGGLQAVLGAYPGMEHQIHTYLNDRLGKTLAGIDENFVVRIYGQRRSALLETAQEVRTALSGIDGLWNVRTLETPVEPQVQVEVDLAKAARIGVKPGDVRRAASTLFAGIEVGQIFESQKVFEVVVWSKPESRRSVSSIANAQIELPGAGHVRLGDVAEVKVLPSPSIVRRENISLFIDVAGQIRGHSFNEIAGDARERLRNIKFPLGYHPKILGNMAVSEASGVRLLVAAATAFFGILLVMQAAFGSWRHAAGNLLLLPLTMSGAIAAALIVSGALSLGALLGLLAIFTLTVRQSMALTSRYIELSAEYNFANSAPFAAAAVRERVTPVIVSAVCIALAMAPMIYYAGKPGLEFMTPMAVAMLGGLVTSTLTVLFALPAVLVHIGAGREVDLSLELAR